MANKTLIYVDNAATTPVSDRVLAAMLPYFQQHYGNPSSIYQIGREASLAIEQSRDRIAATIGAKSSEIFFTSGGSESDNWAIQGAAQLGAKTGKNHIITTAIEHHAVLHTVQFLGKMGFDITILPVDSQGIVSVESVRAALRPETALVTILYANNEIGTLQPVDEIGALCREHKVLFHTDAVQAVGAVPIDLSTQPIDLLSLSGHKLNAPKGVGVLYIRRGVALPNLIHGGAQERGRRAGTENTPSIVGLATAMEDATATIAEKDSLLRAKTNKLMDGLLQISHSRLNGHRTQRLASNVNISFEGIEGESLLLLLDHVGIAASSGSACTSGSLDPSHVLLAIGLVHEVAHGSLRISISTHTTDQDIDYILEQVPLAVEKLRQMSPLWDQIQKRDKQ